MTTLVEAYESENFDLFVTALDSLFNRPSRKALMVQCKELLAYIDTCSGDEISHPSESVLMDVDEAEILNNTALVHAMAESFSYLSEQHDGVKASALEHAMYALLEHFLRINHYQHIGQCSHEGKTYIVLSSPFGLCALRDHDNFSMGLYFLSETTKDKPLPESKIGKEVLACQKRRRETFGDKLANMLMNNSLPAYS